MKVTGKNVLVYIKDGADYKLYACATSVTLDVATEMLETSISGQGQFATFIPGKNSFTGTLEGVTDLGDDTKLTLLDLRTKQLAHTLLTMKFQRTAGEDTYTDEADFYISDSNDVGSYDGMNQFSITLQGTGELKINPSGGDAVTFEYRYGWVGLDTVVTGPDYTPLTEEDFFDSLENVATDGAQYSGTGLNTNDPVQVDDFQNTSDKVVFLEVPKTQAVFTKWSEVGNPLQQNQPIDQVFNYGSGNVFFMSEMDTGKWLYISYFQTSFAGAIIFS